MHRGPGRWLSQNQKEGSEIVVNINGKEYDIKEFYNNQKQVTSIMAAQHEAMLDMIRRSVIVDKKGYEANVPLIMKTYLFQEALNISLLSQIAWCKQQRLTIGGITKQGIIISDIPDGIELEKIEDQIGGVVARTCGFQRKIKVETIQDIWSVIVD